MFNDRPAGFGRNTARVSRAVDVNGNFSYALSFGKKKIALPARHLDHLVRRRAGAPRRRARRLTSAGTGCRFGVSMFNLTNHANYTGYSGVVISPFFGKPKSVQGQCRVAFNANLSF